MSATAVTRRARTLLTVALTGLAIALSGLCFMVITTHAKLARSFFAADTQTGLLVERYPPHQHIVVFWRIYEHLADALVVLTGIAVVAVVLGVVALYWLDRAGRLRRPRIVAPLLLPLLLGLGVGLLSHWQLADQLATLHRLVSSAPIHYGSDGLCSRWIEPCSKLVAFESARALALVGMAVALLLLMPAGLVAWRAGASGVRLGTGWSGAAVLCFVVGVFALTATRGYRSDREGLLATCEADPTPWGDRASHRGNTTTTELHGVHVDRCDPALWLDIAGFAGEYQLFADGTLAELPGVGAPSSSVDERLDAAALVTSDIYEDLEDGIRHALEIGEMRGEEVRPVILLYLDERSSSLALGEALKIAKLAQVAEVVLIGEAIIEFELETLGVRQRRVYCPLARLRFDPSGQPIEAFETGAALVSAAVDAQPEALAIAL